MNFLRKHGSAVAVFVAGMGVAFLELPSLPYIAALIAGFTLSTSALYVLDATGNNELFMKRLSRESWYKISWACVVAIFLAVVGLWLSSGMVQTICSFIGPFFLGFGMRTSSYVTILRKREKK